MLHCYFNGMLVDSPDSHVSLCPLKDGCTPLHLCVRNASLVKYNELIPLLVAHGAQINAKTKVVTIIFYSI